MQKFAGFLIIACLFLCLTFNSTLPFSKDSSKSSRESNYSNLVHQNQRCDLIERTKKMASNLENTLHRIKDSTQDMGKTIYDHINTGLKNLAHKDSITEDDIRLYEELVIKKKYPYLDLKALEMKHNPHLSKNVRQSEIFSQSLQNEPGLHCNPIEDSLNVEVINRGLSGFAIPPHLVKQIESTDSKVANKVEGNSNKANEALPKVFDSRDSVLKTLKDDINTYLERKKMITL